MSKLSRDLSNVTEQLTTYYKGQGLYGKRLRRAVRNDRLYVKHNGGNTSKPLSYQLDWAQSVQGHTYWCDRDSKYCPD